jgi:hypothetical protein
MAIYYIKLIERKLDFLWKNQFEFANLKNIMKDHSTLPNSVTIQSQFNHISKWNSLVPVINFFS